MREPGLDRHEWETRWEALEPDLEDSPGEALAEVGALVCEMLLESGLPLGDEVADDGVERELIADFREAERVRLALERGDDVDPGDVGNAVELKRDLYRDVLARLNALQNVAGSYN